MLSAPDTKLCSHSPCTSLVSVDVLAFVLQIPMLMMQRCLSFLESLLVFMWSDEWEHPEM